MKALVYYDGSCSICRREIDFYRRRRGAEKFQWVDLSTAPEALPDGVTLKDALSTFHIQTSEGRVLRGATAFAAVWSELPAFRAFGIVSAMWPFNWLLSGLYSLFLQYRNPTPAQCGLSPDGAGSYRNNSSSRCELEERS